MPRMSQSNCTEKTSPESQRGQKIGSQALSSLTHHLVHVVGLLSVFHSHAHRRKTQIFLSPPQAWKWKVPLILKSKDQSGGNPRVRLNEKKKKKTQVVVQTRIQNVMMDRWKEKKEKKEDDDWNWKEPGPPIYALKMSKKVRGSNGI